jgi:hypothetical protein
LFQIAGAHSANADAGDVQLSTRGRLTIASQDMEGNKGERRNGHGSCLKKPAAGCLYGRLAATIRFWCIGVHNLW